MGVRFLPLTLAWSQAGPPHISVSEEGPRLEFDQEGSTIPDILAPMVSRLGTRIGTVLIKH